MPMLLSRSTLARLQSVAAPAVAWLCVLAIAACLGAIWFWRITAPAVAGALYAPVADPGNAANEVSSRHLFGIPAVAPPPTATATVATVAELRIVGVMTGSQHSPGFAVVQEEDKTSHPVIEGEELRPGLRLDKVLPQGIEVSHDGRRERLSLSDNQGAIIPPVPVLTPMSPPPAMTAPSVAVTPSNTAISGKAPLLREGEANPAEKSKNE